MLEPKVRASPRLSGLKELMKTPKEVTSPDLRGIREMMAISKDEKTPDLDGIKELLATPKDAGQSTHKRITKPRKQNGELQMPEIKPSPLTSTPIQDSIRVTRSGRGITPLMPTSANNEEQ